MDGEYDSMEFCCNDVDIGPGAVAGVERAENTNGAVGLGDSLFCGKADYSKCTLLVLSWMRIALNTDNSFYRL